MSDHRAQLKSILIDHGVTDISGALLDALASPVSQAAREAFIAGWDARDDLDEKWKMGRDERDAALDTYLTRSGEREPAPSSFDIGDLLGRLTDDAGLCRERSVACRKIGDIAGAETASQICDDLDEVCALLGRMNGTRQPAPSSERELLRTLQPDVLPLLNAMSEDWGWPADHMAGRIADDGGPVVTEKRVKALYRAFETIGWAWRHHFCSEDDNLIRGSGYSLSADGSRARQALASTTQEPAEFHMGGAAATYAVTEPARPDPEQADQRHCFGGMTKHEVYLAGYRDATTQEPTPSTERELPAWLETMPYGVVAGYAFNDGCREETHREIVNGRYNGLKLKAEMVVEMVGDLQDQTRAYLATHEPALDLHTLEEAAKRIERHFGHLAWSQTIADDVRALKGGEQ